MLSARSHKNGTDACLSLLRQCGEWRDLNEGKKLHSQLAATGEDQTTYAGNLLVRLYGNCGQLQETLAAFSRIERRNVFSWTILFTAYARAGHLHQSRYVFERMPQRDAVSWTGMIGLYGRFGCLDGSVRVFETMPEKDFVPWNALITANAADEDFTNFVFEKMPGWNLLTCNVMLQSYAQNGRLKEANGLFLRLPERDPICWNLVLQARSLSGSLHEAVDTFERMPKWDRISWIALISAHAQAGSPESARELFDQIPEQNVASFTAMIQAYAQQGQAEEAKELFDRVSEHDVFSWNAMLAAYSQSFAVSEAREIFNRMPGRNLISWNVMIQAYSQVGEAHEAETLFNALEHPDVISWTAMLTAYGLSGQLQQAWRSFTCIPRPNSVSWNALLYAYSQNGELDSAKLVFDRMPGRNVVAWTTMITCYAQSDRLDDTRRVFDEIPEQDSVSWTAMIAAYAENTREKLALHLFRCMDLEGLKPDRITYTSVLQACSSLVAPREGKIIHSTIVDSRSISEISVGTSLINMYGKCGLLADARRILHKMPQRDIGCWTSMIVAYAQNGFPELAIDLFRCSNLEGVPVDYITLVSVLCACSHGGMLGEAWEIFISAQADYFAEVTLDQYLCMIGLLGKAGEADRAEELVEQMPFEPDVVAWMILLSACRSVGDSKRGARVALRVFWMDPDNASAFLLLSNTHAAAGNWDAAAEVRRVMSQRGVQKRPGWSFIDFFLAPVAV